MTKRLFLFAGYDADNTIDDTLIYYLNQLSKLGDIVLVMDNSLNAQAVKKLSEIPHILHFSGTHHGEYDFGSYKRGYIWARDNKKLDKYEWVYMVNDSVYGPFWDIKNILSDLESRNTDAIGMVEYCESDYPPPPDSPAIMVCGIKS